MHLYFLSGPRKGHCHDDKNSFILEAYGKLLLLDRGTPAYTHPAISVSKETAAHNAVAPDGLSQTVAPDVGGAILLRAVESKDGVVAIESDATGCWPGLARRVLRKLTHHRPATLIVEDTMDWERPVVSAQYWQSHGEWRNTPEGWVTNVEGVELCVSVLAPADAVVTAAPYSVDGNLRPVNRLVVGTPQAPSARITTLLRVRPTPLSPWPARPAQA